MKHLQILDNYFADVDEMFKEAKEHFEFDLFAKSCKKTILATIDTYTNYRSEVNRTSIQCRRFM